MQYERCSFAIDVLACPGCGGRLRLLATIAGGLSVLDGALGAIFSMRTQPRFRRSGLASATLLALAAWARDAGTRWLFLQVEDDNPVRELYQSLGFARQHGYRYREHAPAAQP